MHIFVLYIIAITILTFIVYGIDKYKATHNKWRIPEASLIGLAIIGGSIGALAGMKIWHHKTLHPKFKYGIPIIIIFQIIVLVWWFCPVVAK